jgi:hypothetical protein
LKPRLPAAVRLLSRVVAFCALLLVAAGPASAAVKFAPGQSYGSTEAHNGIVAADFDGDGDNDVAYVASPLEGSRSGGFLGLRPNDGKGKLGAEILFPADDGPTHIAAGDLNGDGKPDVVVTARELASDTVSVYLNTGGGFAARTSYKTAGGPQAVDLADLDGDGDLDVVVAGFADPQRGPGRPPTGVATHLNAGDGSLGAPALYGARDEGEPFDVATGDFNRDGRPDVAVADFNFGLAGQNVYVYLGTGGGALGAPVLYATGAASDIAAADLDGDGDDDLVVGSDKATVLLATGDGGFTAAREYGNVNASELALGDLDGDRDTDIAVGTQGLRALLGNGRGAFSLDPGVFQPGGARLLIAADLNGDGLDDLAQADFGVTTYLNRTAAARPRIVLSGVPRGCVRKAFTARVTVSGPVKSTDVHVDGRRVKRSTADKFTVKVAAGRRGTHRIVVTAKSTSGAKSTRRASFKRC